MKIIVLFWSSNMVVVHTLYSFWTLSLPSRTRLRKIHTVLGICHMVDLSCNGFGICLRMNCETSYTNDCNVQYSIHGENHCESSSCNSKRLQKEQRSYLLEVLALQAELAYVLAKKKKKKKKKRLIGRILLRNFLMQCKFFLFFISTSHYWPPQTI